LGENASEEAQVARDIVCHDRRKRFHNSVNAKNTLKKLHYTKKNTSVQNLEKYINAKSIHKQEGNHCSVCSVISSIQLNPHSLSITQNVTSAFHALTLVSKHARIRLYRMSNTVNMRIYRKEKMIVMKQ